jgi:hypothetical protein
MSAYTKREHGRYLRMLWSQYLMLKSIGDRSDAAAQLIEFKNEKVMLRHGWHDIGLEA